MSVRSFWNNRNMIDANKDRCIYVFKCDTCGLDAPQPSPLRPDMRVRAALPKAARNCARARRRGQSSLQELQCVSAVVEAGSGLALGDGKVEFYVTRIWCGLLTGSKSGPLWNSGTHSWPFTCGDFVTTWHRESRGKLKMRTKN